MRVYIKYIVMGWLCVHGAWAMDMGHHVHSHTMQMDDTEAEQVQDSASPPLSVGSHHHHIDGHDAAMPLRQTDAYREEVEQTSAGHTMPNSLYGVIVEQLGRRFTYNAPINTQVWITAGEGWYGTDNDRWVVGWDINKGKQHDDVHVDMAWRKPISAYWNGDIGLRYMTLDRTQEYWMLLGVNGLAPYWFHTVANALVSDSGQVLMQLKSSYDARLTQRLVFEPYLEADVALKEQPQLAIAQGLYQWQLGARLRYSYYKMSGVYMGWQQHMSQSLQQNQLSKSNTQAVEVGAKLYF